MLNWPGQGCPSGKRLPNKDETVVDEFYVYAFFDPCGDKPFYIGKGHSDRMRSTLDQVR